MKLAEVLVKSPKQFILEIQQELLYQHPSFETELHYLKPDDERNTGFDCQDMLKDENIICMTVTVLDMKPKVEVYIGETSLQPYALNSSRALPADFKNLSIRDMAFDVYKLMVAEFINQCNIQHSEDRDVTAVFKAFIETEKVHTIHDVFEVMVDKDDEEGSKSVETRYNGTVFGIKKLKNGSEAFLVVKGV